MDYSNVDIGINQGHSMRLGGTYDFATIKDNQKIKGVIKFPLNERFRSKRKINNGPLIFWYCPFTANDITDTGRIIDLSINSEELYFFGEEKQIHSCYRGITPKELLSDKYKTDFSKVRSYDEVVHYSRIPRFVFDKVFWNNRGKFLEPSLELFVRKSTSKSTPFKRPKSFQIKELKNEMNFHYPNECISHIYRASLEMRLL